MTCAFATQGAVHRLQQPTYMLLSTDQLASHVAAHAGVSPALAEHALRGVITGIGGYLSPASRQLVAEELPPPLASALGSAIGDQRPIEDRVQIAGLTPGRTRELIASVCRVLAEELSDDAVRALTAALPGDIATLFVPSSPEVLHPSPAYRQPGSVAEPNPHGEGKLSSGPPGLPQPDSVADVNPHGDTKLSSSRGGRGEPN
jgi:uncharacterized protein (DUF2267 family)